MNRLISLLVLVAMLGCSSEYELTSEEKAKIRVMAAAQHTMKHQNSGDRSIVSSPDFNHIWEDPIHQVGPQPNHIDDRDSGDATCPDCPDEYCQKVPRLRPELKVTVNSREGYFTVCDSTIGRCHRFENARIRMRQPVLISIGNKLYYDQVNGVYAQIDEFWVHFVEI